MDGYYVEWTDRLGVERRRDFRPENSKALAAATEFQRQLAAERKTILAEVEALMESYVRAGKQPELGDIPIVPGIPYMGVIPPMRRAG